MKFFGVVEAGKMRVYHRREFDRYIRTLSGDVTLTVTNRKENRSTQQNRYWWLLVTILAAEIGYEKCELHEILKYKFLRREKIDEKTGEVFEYLGSSATLNKEEFATMIEQLFRWASETFDVILPEVNTQIKML